MTRFSIQEALPSIFCGTAAPFSSGVTFTEETRNEAAELGKNLVQSWEDKAVFPQVEKAKADFRERMRLLTFYRREGWPYEWEYWQKHRGLTWHANQNRTAS